jgi:excisionase family DNA binding protein
MAIDTSGMITVAEAAKRLKLSQEQVRRNLRDGKLRGQRVGNQWFVDEHQPGEEIPRPLISEELWAEIHALRDEIAPKLRDVDLVEYMRELRDND